MRSVGARGSSAASPAAEKRAQPPRSSLARAGRPLQLRGKGPSARHHWWSCLLLRSVDTPRWGPILAGCLLVCPQVHWCVRKAAKQSWKCHRMTRESPNAPMGRQSAASRRRAPWHAPAEPMNKALQGRSRLLFLGLLAGGANSGRPGACAEEQCRDRPSERWENIKTEPKTTSAALDSQLHAAPLSAPRPRPPSQPCAPVAAVADARAAQRRRLHRQLHLGNRLQVHYVRPIS